MHEPVGTSFDGVMRLATNANVSATGAVARPFVKWAGGKRSILKDLLERTPPNCTAYKEPFLGGGAFFFALKPKDVYLSDINFHLIQTYRAIRDSAELVIHRLEIHKKKHGLDYYKKARGLLNEEQDPVEVASLFIYLNKTCYNGLYRVNKSGLFNVPIGKYKAPAIADECNIRACSARLQRADVHQHSFVYTPIEKGHFYYLDPPYHETYSGYDGSGFSDDEHKRLAQFCHTLDTNSAKFMLSNNDTPLIRQLYAGYKVETVGASRCISCKSNKRGKEMELIIRNY